MAAFFRDLTTFYLLILSILKIDILYITLKAFEIIIKGRCYTYYIKNAFSGQYLDVYDGQASNGTNVIQYLYNGGRNQQWLIKYNEDGTFTFYSQLALDYVLNVNGGFNNDLTNVQLWSYNGGDSQKFKIGYTSTSTYAILSKCSNYSKAVVTHGCRQEPDAYYLFYVF